MHDDPYLDTYLLSRQDGRIATRRAPSRVLEPNPDREAIFAHLAKHGSISKLEAVDLLGGGPANAPCVLALMVKEGLLRKLSISTYALPSDE